MSSSKREAVDAALSVAEDIASGKLPAAELDAMVAAECERLFDRAVGPEDPLWVVQCRVARRVLAAGGVPANELAEWLAVTRLAEGEPEAGPSWIERALAEGAEDGDDDA